ncbi:hypothetical protein [Enhygromyxa salina]|uniref:Lipoprotein n=1 Tax=Enhygromyxa salina TaxID=215803 RepID=A0A2S9YIY2_9BACT|nr:hypothetical protein [Enhygromyxa salina]PRQ05064.1 hypothetical protein ENSA7_48170 [Enhygromyxa salina]
MRAATRAGLMVPLLLVGCGGPLAALPIAQAVAAPEALAAPMEDGSVYVLTEGTALTAAATLKSMWRRKARSACQGEYMVLAERAAQSQRGGVVGSHVYEGFVRCISAEGMGINPDRDKIERANSAGG